MGTYYNSKHQTHQHQKIMYIISISFTQFPEQPNTIYQQKKTSNMLKTTKLITNPRKPTKDFTFSSSSKSCKRLHSNNLFHLLYQINLKSKNKQSN